MRRSRLLSATSVRLGAIYALLLLVTFLIAGGAAWVVSRKAALDSHLARVRAEVQLVRQTSERDGLEAAIALIGQRVRHPTTFVYRLEDYRGRVIAGDASLPNLVLGWRLVDLPDVAGAAPRGDFIVLTEPWLDGSRLTIGDDVEQTEQIRNAVLGALAGIGGAAVLLGLAAAFWITRGSLRRIDALTAAVRSVGAGNLDARAPLRRDGGDDIDELTRTFNTMLDRIDLLVGNLRRMSANVAHDLRTPLAHVRQNLEAIAEAPSDEARQSAVDDAQRSVDGVLRTFDAMLRLAEIEAGAMRSRFAPVNLAALLEHVGDAFRPDVEAAGQTLTIDAPAPVTVEGDAQLLQQAIANLITNAMRYAGAQARIQLSAARDGGVIKLVVQDNGPGIAPDHRERLQQPFERMDESRGRRGAGLGLSIVAAIARLHDAQFVLGDAGPGCRAMLLFR